MNGAYLLSQTPKANGTKERFPAQYRDYPRGVEYFDVYSPAFRTLYSQVWWQDLDPVPLPEHIVRRFNGSAMAVVGFEIDQVRRTSDGDVPVPMSVSYNHHFESMMTGRHAVLQKVPSGSPLLKERMRHMGHNGHGSPAGDRWAVMDFGTGIGEVPTFDSFGGANGGEMRKSFHGYAPGFAQVVQSPTQFQVTPMQIDTWNRAEMNVSHPTRFVPGPVPRSSQAPTEGPDAIYSGLLECPVTTRIRKVVDPGYAAQVGGACPEALGSAELCLKGVKALLGEGRGPIDLSVGTGHPAGCTVLADASDHGRLHAFFSPPHSGRDSGSAAPACADGVLTFAGLALSLVRVEVQLEAATKTARIKLAGPSDAWFGVGFNATSMADEPWAVVVDGAGTVSEHRLGNHILGQPLEASVQLEEEAVSGGTRTVVVTRPWKGATPDHFTFDPQRDMKLRLITALGKGPELSYHKDKAPGTMTIVPVADDATARGACICSVPYVPFGQAEGSLVYVPTEQAADTGAGNIAFSNGCPPSRRQLLEERNPTCDVRMYSGGQLACHHMFSLLDADQEIPWADQPLEMHLKFRFWVQQYDPLYHSIVYRTTWGIASPVEYDVPKCALGVPGCSRGADGSWIHTLRGTWLGGHGNLVSAHFHCHAPSCLSFALYRCRKGTPECNESNGELLCREVTVFGGTGRVQERRFDEEGFILQPPCLWGSPEHGLERPPSFTGYVLGAVKTSNATYGHHGEMAWLQVFYVKPGATPDLFV